MVKRSQYTISLSDDEAERIRAVAKASGETLSGYVRRQVMIIVREEELLKDDY